MPQKDLHDAFFILLLLKLDNFEYVLVFISNTKTNSEQSRKSVTECSYSGNLGKFIF